ncbi:FAD-binding oxidoreductase [Salipiger sp. 1_MG-2023]|uniref:FAD-binding oxidoreductase n=1 Tax=Salipiger sp. 1_MG-2023 TaxID=3062665 RepID=UPI0026E31F6B|nr:FAD-binding oxidoreductase [Salipiger sp. 1_MG-2023]MDO6584378.1 FAD-binding oxidoreductase [Salipiger sp. 1_MG-2023]
MSLHPTDDRFAQTLAGQLPDGALRRAEPRYLEEPRGRWKGTSQWVALPRSVEEAAIIIRACNAARVGVLPFGGGTGLVGGQVSPDTPAPLIVSMERMAAIRAVLPDENVLVAEAGAVLADVQQAALDAGRLFALSLASEGTARIGGLLATNAGGVNVLRYGNARDQVLGLEAVLPDGSVWNGLKRLRKDNTGYDLRHLLIGAEGTLGLITAATLKLSAIPAASGTALFTVARPKAALALLALARGQLGEGISAFELISRQGLAFQRETLPDLRHPWESPPEWCVLIELGLARGLDPAGALETLFEAGLEAGLVSDGIVAQSEQQRQDFWAIRERMPEANRLVGAISSHDISVPLSLVPEFIDRGGPMIATIGDFRINCFGHLGDGNLHYNVFPLRGGSKHDHAHQRDDIKRAVHDLVHEMGGSVSAEHGIGRLKTGDLERYGDPAKLAAMRAIKAALDPNGIMNPGAVLRR